jgi:outer membrane protein assembly factor BamB
MALSAVSTDIQRGTEMRLAACIAALMLTIGVVHGTAEAQVVSSAGISPQGAASLGLERAWTTKVSVDSTRGYVVGLVFHKGVLFVSTSQGIVQAIDAEHGATYWTVKVGNAEHVTLPPGASDKYVIVTNGSNLYTLDRRSGRMESQRKLKGGACSGPGMSETHCYIPMFSGAIEIFPLQAVRELDREPTIFFAAGSSLAPPVVRGDRLYWTAKNGYVYADGLTKSEERFRYQTGGQIFGAPTVLPMDNKKAAVVAASHDGVVSAIRDPDGGLLWRHQTGAAMMTAPIAIGEAVYALNDAGRVTKLDYKTGVAVWEAEGAHRFLAASPSRIYVSDRSGNLLMMDSTSGGLLGASFIGTNTVPFVNDQNDRIYVVANNGLIQCLHERAALEPVYHAPPEVDKKPPMPMETTEAPAAVQ